MKLKYWLCLCLLGFSFACKKDKETDDNQDSDNTANQEEEYPIKQSVGFSANDLLSDNTYSKLILEINCYGVYPKPETIDQIQGFLDARLHKVQTSIVLDTAGYPIVGPVDETELRSEDEASRTRLTKDETIVVNCNYFDAEYHNENVLGVAFYNTSIALFGAKINEISGGALQPPTWQVESTVFLHELGHILGLVNTGSDMIIDHQDEANGHHCDDDECLMYWSVET
ncbi:MAG: hypothetical protein MRY83_21695, partial [Flavobacteriales bacterium]|nr:hypothetical protein [Flavobacteriales bacterium]